MDRIRRSRQNRMITYMYDIIAHTFSDSEQARRCAKRNAALQIAVATAALVMMVRIFPMGLVQNHTLSGQKAYDRTEKTAPGGDIFTASDKKLQTVFFEKEHIYQIILYMGCIVEPDDSGLEGILFRLYDDKFSCIYEEEADSRTIEKKGHLAATPDLDVETGRAYYYEILVPDESQAAYFLPVADRERLGQTENGTLYIDGIINDEVSLVADFDYSFPLTVAGIVARECLIAAAALLIYFLALIPVWIYDNWLAGYAAQMKKWVRTGTGALSIIAAVVLFVFSVILNRFGGEIWDRLFFMVGIIVAEVWIIGFLWRPTRIARPRRHSDLPAGRKIWLVWRNYVQTVCFGLLFYALCQYVNADREFYHYTNTRWMLVFLAIAFLMNYNERQFVNWTSAIWLAAGIVGSVFYCNTARADENELLLARLACGVVLTWGLLVLNIIQDCVFHGKIHKIKLKRIKRKIMRNKQQAVFAALWTVFCILMYVYRYEKAWVFTASLPFVALLFAKSTPAARGRFLKNFCNGIFLSFALMAGFCLLHRPHHYWMLYRYGAMFHTVACAGMYLAVVFGAAAAKLYGRLKTRKNMLLFCFREYFVTACAAGFILLTMSRTAFLTALVTVLAVVALTAAAYRKSAGRIFAELGVLVMVCAVSFPMVFTALRIVPAVVNDPVRYDIEFQDRSFMIYKGDPVDSDKYMTVRRFFATLFGRFQGEGQEADAGLTLQESGALAYTGADLAGLGVGRTYGGTVDISDAQDILDTPDISNGRFGIFKEYLGATEMKGHPKMGPADGNGGEYPHAHNSYLQVAYNFGMIAGVIFLILCALTLWRSVRLFVQYKDRYGIFLVPFALVVVFGFESLTEWAFHPCIPAGFSFILVQMVLMRDCRDVQGRQK